MNTVAAIKNGDTELFEEVYYLYHEKLYFYVLSKVHSTYLSEETVQEAFVKLWRFRDHLNEDLSISVQLFRIAKSCMIDMLRKQSSQTSLKETMPVIADTASPIEDVEYKELNRACSHKGFIIVRYFFFFRKIIKDIIN